MGTRYQYDEAYDEGDIYDDDEPGHHPVDDDDDDDDLDPDAPGLDLRGLGLDDEAGGTGDHPTDWDRGLTEDRLAELAGTDDLATCSHLEIRADATRDDLSGVGRAMPALTKLRLSSSVVPAARAFGSAFQRLQVLWIARSGLEDLSGVGALVQLRELYAAFNDVTDVSPLAELDELQVVDLEANRVVDEDAPDYLGMCPALNTLSLEGNPISRRRDYRNFVARAVKGLRTLDDIDVTESERCSSKVGDGMDAAVELSRKGETEADASGSGGDDGVDELSMVTDGIKYAAVGIDDPDAVITRDTVTGDLSIEVAEDPLHGDGDGVHSGSEFFPSRPSTGTSARPGTSTSTVSRGCPPRPGTSASSGGVSNDSSRPTTANSLARSNSLGAALRSANSSRPGTAKSVNAFSRPGTAASAGSRSRPGTATSWGNRPGTASRPGSREWGMQGRPGTSGSGASRPGTAMSAEGWGFGGDSLQDSLFWKKNRVKETRAGLADRGDSADGGGSKLTIGAGTLVGNPAKLLSRRKKEAPVDAIGIEDDSDGAGEKDDILAQLRKWKIEMAESFSRFQLGRDMELEFEVPEEREAMPAPPPRPPPTAPPRFTPAPPKMVPHPPPPRGGRPRPGGRSVKGVESRPRSAVETSSGGVDRLVLE